MKVKIFLGDNRKLEEIENRINQFLQQRIHVCFTTQSESDGFILITIYYENI